MEEDLREGLEEDQVEWRDFGAPPFTPTDTGIRDPLSGVRPKQTVPDFFHPNESS